ncbi:MAG: hypothetical protein LBV17_08820 [Treponema sp.]|nr:hypothetical protein [Treponema sp.]
MIIGKYKYLNNDYWLSYLLNVAVLEIFYNIIINPLYLIIINMVHSMKFKKKLFIVNILLMILSCLLGLLLYYFNFGIMTGDLLKLDVAMLNILNLKCILIIIIIGIIEQTILLLFYKMKWKKEI